MFVLVCITNLVVEGVSQLEVDNLGLLARRLVWLDADAANLRQVPVLAGHHLVHARCQQTPVLAVRS